MCTWQPDNALYHRWIYACPFSGGKWRAALDYDWHLDAAAALANAPSDQVA